MSDEREIIAALEVRIAAHDARIAAHDARTAELERRLAASERRRHVGMPRASRRTAVMGLLLMLLAVPGVVLAGHRFSDVPNGHPFHDDIDWLADYGIANGFADGTYRPGQAVTRQAMAAFLHRLSNEFEVVNNAWNPPAASMAFAHTAFCPDDKRPIAGGGSTNTSDLLMTESYPVTNYWYVRWETDNNVAVDPSTLTVYALCAPRL